jgi:hypothetical protein
MVVWFATGRTKLRSSKDPCLQAEAIAFAGGYVSVQSAALDWIRSLASGITLLLNLTV